MSGTAGFRDYKSLGLIGTVTTVGREEGILAFWKGIPAAWLREASYTSLRLGLYAPIKKAIGADQEGAGFLIKFAAGCAAGGLGSIAGNPFDVLKTKMMAAEGEGIGFATTVRQIMASQGVGGFYKGMDANIMRAMVNNGTKMACYDMIKKKIKSSGVVTEGIPLQFLSAFSAGFIMTCTVAPFDICRTRLMNQPADKPKVYFNLFDTFAKIATQEGPQALWRGFIPMWARIAPTTTLQLLFFEKFSKLAGISAT